MGKIRLSVQNKVDRKMIIIRAIIATTIFQILRASLLFYDGYNILNDSQRYSIDFCFLPLIYLVVLYLSIAGIRKKKKEAALVATWFTIITIIVAVIMVPIGDKIRTYGFKTRIEQFWNLDKLMQCSDLLVESNINNLEPVSYTVFDDEELPACIKSIISGSTDKEPHIVINRRHPYCLVRVEYENYTITVMPRNFPILKLLHSIHKGRVYFTYSERENRSWKRALSLKT